VTEITGIELGPNCCVLVRAAEHAPRATVAAARAFTPGEWTDDHDELVSLLRAARRSNRLSPRARVVAWGLHDAASAADLSHLPELGPLVAAGFEIETIVSPVQALAQVVTARQGKSDDRAVAALSINHHGVAIAIVSKGAAIASRVFEWPLGRPFAAGRSELLERYLIVSQVAPELQHLIDLVRPVHGVTVTSAIACGNLPNLRSLAMLLIDELDLEVDTLDSAELLAPGSAGRFVDLVPALQLAAHVATPARTDVAGSGGGAAGDVRDRAAAHDTHDHSSQPPTREPRRVSALIPFASVAAAVLCTTWSALALAGTSPATPVFRDGLALIADGLPPVPDLAAEGTIGRVGVRPDAAPRSRAPEAPVEEATEQTRPLIPGAEPLAATEGRAANPAPPAIPRVDGIMIAGDRRLAIVEGSIVGVGDAVGSHVIARIERDGVVFRSRSGREVHVAIRMRKPPTRGS
jgi:hypothetical protein